MPTVKFECEAPSPRQQEFFNSTAKHTAYGGAKGGGKSWAMRRKFEGLALAYPNLRLLLLRRTYQQLRDNHIENMKRELFGVANYVESRYAFEFPNGSVIRCGFCDNDIDVDNYQGIEFDVVGFEEATLFTEYQLTQLSLSARNVRPDFTPRCYYTCNPGGPGHYYIKRLFIDREFNTRAVVVDGKEIIVENPEDYVFIPAKVYDNLALMKNNPGYIATLEALPEHRRKLLLEGDWDAVEGQFFDEFNATIHVIDPLEEIPLAWKRFVAMDWGYNDPCCVLWFAVAGSGRVYITDEIYARKVNPSDMAERIKYKSREMNIAYTVASPDMWEHRGQKDVYGGECIAETFMHNGVYPIKADSSRVIGWQRIREMLALAPDGLPYLQIFSTCKNLIRTLPALCMSRNDSDDIEGHCEDHAAEALRYGCMSRPSPKIIPKSRYYTPPPPSPFTPARRPAAEKSGYFGI